MMKMKVGGIILTGFGAYLAVSKTIAFLDRTVSKIVNASVDKAYYKAVIKTGNPDIARPVYKNSASAEALKQSISKAIDEVVETHKKPKKDAEGPLEDEIEASEEEEEGVCEESEPVDDEFDIPEVPTDEGLD